MAINIKIGEPIVVNSIKRGTNERGPWVKVMIYERDNANVKPDCPSFIKCWATDLDSAITDGCKAVLKSFDQISLEHVKHEIGDRKRYNDETVIRGAVFEVYKEK